MDTIIQQLKIDLGDSFPLVMKMESLQKEIPSILRSEENFLKQARRLKLKIFTPYMQSSISPKIAFVAVGEKDEVFIRNETNEIEQTLNIELLSELNDLLELNESEKRAISQRLDYHMTSGEILKYADLIEEFWEKVALEMEMGESIYSIKSSTSCTSDFDKAIECLNKSFQANCSKFTAHWFIVKLLRSGGNLLSKEKLLQNFGLDKYINKEEKVITFLLSNQL